MRRLLLIVALFGALPAPAHAQLNVSAPIVFYSASKQGLAPAATPTDIFTIAGSSTKTIFITKVIISCTQTTAGAIDVLLIRRSTADTLGTSAAVTMLPHDPNSSAATATVLSYTANPTLGTTVGTVTPYKLACLAPTTATPEDILIERFDPGEEIVLRGTAHQFAVNLNSVSVTGGSFNIRIEWFEN